jgi:branched-chain amino acid aminotransferase
MRPIPKLQRQHEDPHTYPSGVAYLDGQYVSMKEAKVSVLDYGFLHSDATYDTVHVWNGSLFRLDLHLDRFFRGMQRLHMTVPYSREDVERVLHGCVALSGLRNAYVEMICTRGTSPSFSRDPRDAVNRFMAFAVPFGSVANPEQMQRGLRVTISDIVRISPKSVDPGIKNYHWLDLVMGLYDAYAKGGETALLLDMEGNIAEGPGFNIFAVKEGRLTTPEFGVLPGITRQSVFDICASLQLPVQARAVTPNGLAEAEEVFITSTAGGVMPVTSLDGRAIGSGQPGPVTRRITDEYWARHADHPWATPVSYPSEAQSRPVL